MSDDRHVVLIGGAPGVGKSTLGRGLAARSGAVSLTMDDVMTGIRSVTDAGSHPEFHPMRRAGGHVPYFTESEPDQIVAEAIALERASWPAVEAIVAMHTRAGPPIVIDWWLLRPADVASLDGKLVASLWVHLDPEALWARERRNTGFLTGSPDPERMLANFMHRSTWRNELIAAEADELGLPVLRLSGTEAVDDVVDMAVAATTR